MMSMQFKGYELVSKYFVVLVQLLNHNADSIRCHYHVENHISIITDHNNN